MRGINSMDKNLYSQPFHAVWPVMNTDSKKEVKNELAK